MSPVITRHGLMLLLSPLALAACSSGDPSESTGASSDALGEPEAAGFVTPSLTAASEQAVFAGYAHLDPARLIADNLLLDAVAYFDANKARLRNRGHLAIVDFAKPSGKKRLYLVDMQTGEVTPHVVAHGAGSDGGDGYARTFSDTDGSHKSSLGFVVTGSTFSSAKHGRALLLFGLSRSNAHLRSREIIVHSADYVSESSSRQGTSWGCFALDPRVKDGVVTALANGALLYAGLGRPNSGARTNGVADSPTPTTPDPDPTTPGDPATIPEPAAPAPAGGGACTTDGACNPGVDGSGMICVAGTCTPGCHTNNQCPGITTCRAGACR